MPKVIPEEQILEAVIRLISEKSYQGASTREMAQAAGVSEITLFRKYGTKAALTKKALGRLFKDEKIKSAFKATGNLASDLIRIVDVYQNLFSRYGNFLVVLIVEVPRSPELKDLLEIQAQVAGGFTSLISHYQQDGQLREEPAHLFMSALLGPLMYEGMLHQARPETPAPRLDSAAYVERFLDGRKKP